MTSHKTSSEAVEGAGEWLLVPKEPTQAMVRAAYIEQPDTINAGFAQAYRAMIASAPLKPAPDAMRSIPVDAETRRDLNVIFRSAVNQRLTGAGTWDDIIGNAIDEIFELAAPVPPPDGTAISSIPASDDAATLAGSTERASTCGHAPCVGIETSSPGAAEPSTPAAVREQSTPRSPASAAMGLSAGVETGAAEPDAILGMLADERVVWRADLHKRTLDRDLERRTINLRAASSPPDDVRSALAVDEPIAQEMHRIKRLFEEKSGDAEDLISYAREVAALRSAPVSTAPPVRDREAIARLIDPHAFVIPYSKRPDIQARQAMAYGKASAILFLPVQSSAAVGVTREAVKHVKLEHPYRPQHADSEYDYLCRRVDEFGAETVVGILKSYALTQPDEGSFAGSLWALAEWVNERMTPAPDATVAEEKSLLDPVVDSRNDQEEATVSARETSDAFDRIAEMDAGFVCRAEQIATTNAAAVSARDAVIEEARQEIVLAIAFLTRDGNTDRITETVRQLIPRLATADEKLRSLAQGAKP